MKPYGVLELTEASPAQTFSEMFTVQQARDFLRIPTWDEETTKLEGMIAGAREQAEILQGRDLIPKQYDLTLDYLPGCPIALRTPLRSVDAFELTNSDGTTTVMVADEDYIVDTRRGLVLPPDNGSWPTFTPWPSSAVLIRFTAGYASTHPFWSNAGQRVKMGMEMLITAWYENRIPYEKGDVSELPYGITALLSYGTKPRVH